MSKPLYVRSRVLAASIVSTLSTVAHAADAPEAKALSKISVRADEDGYKTDVASSPKYTQAPRDTPQTITVIPHAIIKEQGASTFARCAALLARHHVPSG